VTKGLFKEGGPLEVKNLGNDQYHLTITIPKDQDGRIARECPNKNCSPAYFKVTPGTGITGGQKLAFCPYCRHEAEPTDFTTQEQIRYAKDMAIREARGGVNEMVKDALGLNSRGKRKFGGGLVSIEMDLKPSQPKPVRRPFEDEVRRDVVCPHCTLDQTVFGLAAWCSDCGEDIFLTHVSAEVAVTRSMLNDIRRREQDLGRRVAAKDLENCLEDSVSLFEAAAKALTRRALTQRGEDAETVETNLKKVGNSFQNVDRSREQLEKLFGYEPTDSAIWDRLGGSFEKRHPVTHNLGVVDKKYLERAQQAEREGREVRITETEIDSLLKDILHVISELHSEIIGNVG